MVDKKTTIQVSGSTKNKLNELKIHPREPYEDVIIRLLEKDKGNSHG